MSKSSYESRSQQALLRVLEALSTHPLAGRSLDALTEQTAANRNAVYRALKNLEIAGWAEAAPGGGWRPTPKASFLSERVRVAIADLARTYLGDPQ